MENQVEVKLHIAPKDWDFSDLQSPVSRVLRTASALEALALSLRAADAAYSNVASLRTLVVGTGDLAEQLSTILMAQVTRMEGCPHCAHPTQELDVTPKHSDVPARGSD